MVEAVFRQTLGLSDAADEIARLFSGVGTSARAWPNDYSVLERPAPAMVDASDDRPASWGPWQQPCAALFERLIEADPDELLRLVGEQILAPADLTFAAEALGQIKAASTVSTLIRLLAHPSPIVREGAIYGLALHLEDDRVPAKLLSVAGADPSPGVRAAAGESLVDWAAEP